VREGPENRGCHQIVTKTVGKTSKNQQTEEKWESRYLTADNGTWLDFVSDSTTAISFFKTAAFNRSATPPNQTLETF
jgi:hypothetical protein